MSQNPRDITGDERTKPSTSKRGPSGADIRSFFSAKVTKRRQSDDEKSEEKQSLGNQPSNLGMWPKSCGSRNLNYRPKFPSFWAFFINVLTFFCHFPSRLKDLWLFFGKNSKFEVWAIIGRNFQLFGPFS